MESSHVNREKTRRPNTTIRHANASAPDQENLGLGTEGGIQPNTKSSLMFSWLEFLWKEQYDQNPHTKVPTAVLPEATE